MNIELYTAQIFPLLSTAAAPVVSELLSPAAASASLRGRWDRGKLPASDFEGGADPLLSAQLHFEEGGTGGSNQPAD